MADQYTQIKKLGEGAFGVAYLVKDLYYGKNMCMKRISCKGFTEEQEDAVVKEVEVMRGLKHIGIIPMQCAFFDADDLCIVSDYAAGGDLERYLQRCGGHGLPEQEALYLFAQLALAVMAMHHKGVLHRDLKPANILLAEDGTTRIADFGVASMRRDGVHHAVAGTPLYMSPELGDDRPAITWAVDIWALGCVLYEMCTGKTAFEGSIAAVALQVQEGRHRPFPATMSSGVQQLILWCLQTDPSRRPRAIHLLRTPVLQEHIKRYTKHVFQHYQRAVPYLAVCEPVTPIPRLPLQSREPWPCSTGGDADGYGTAYGKCSEFPAGASTMKAPPRSHAPAHGSGCGTGQVYATYGQGGQGQAGSVQEHRVSRPAHGTAYLHAAPQAPSVYTSHGLQGGPKRPPPPKSRLAAATRDPS